MKVLEIFPGKIWGGAEQYILDLSKEINKRGYEVVLIAHDRKPLRDRLSTQPFPTKFLNMKGLLRGYSVVKELAKAMAEGVDVVHIHDFKYAAIAVAARHLSGRKNIRIIATRHIARASATTPWRKPWLKQIDKIIFVSNLAKTLWESKNKWFDKSKGVAILNSIPPAEHSATPVKGLREYFSIPDDHILLMFSGRVRKSKGCETILQALAELNNPKLDIVFVGACKPKTYAAKLKALAEGHKIPGKIYFYGFTAHSRELLKDADIGIAPSIVREACPLAPLEMMQAGKCVITTTNGGQTEYITDNVTGVLVHPDNHHELADKLNILVNDTQKIQEIGENASAYFKSSLSYDKFIDKTLGTLQQ